MGEYFRDSTPEHDATLRSLGHKPTVNSKKALSPEAMEWLEHRARKEDYKTLLESPFTDIGYKQSLESQIKSAQEILAEIKRLRDEVDDLVSVPAKTRAEGVLCDAVMRWLDLGGMPKAEVPFSMRDEAMKDIYSGAIAVAAERAPNPSS